MKLLDSGIDFPGPSPLPAHRRAATVIVSCLLLVAGCLVLPAVAGATEEGAAVAEPIAAAAVQTAATKDVTPASEADTADTEVAATAAAKDDAEPKDKPAAKKSIEDQPLDKEIFAEAEGEAKEVKKADDSGAVGRMIFGLVFVLGLIFAVHWLLKKYGQGRTGVSAAGAVGVIDVLATTPLAADRALHLVRVGDDVVLIGATAQSVTHLRTLSGGGSTDATAAAMGGQDFQRHLYGAMAVGDTAVPASATGYSPSMLASMSGGNTQPQPAAGGSFVRRFLANLQVMTAR